MIIGPWIFLQKDLYFTFFKKRQFENVTAKSFREAQESMKQFKVSGKYENLFKKMCIYIW